MDIMEPSVDLLVQRIASAWGRWSALSIASDASATETQLEPLAMGVVSSWTPEQLHSFHASGATAWTPLVLPLRERFNDDADRFHFVLLVVEMLTADSSPSDQQQGSDLLQQLLQSSHYARVHSVALRLLQQFVRQDVSALARVTSSVYAMLTAAPSLSNEDEATSIGYDSLCSLLQMLLQCKDDKSAVLDQAHAVCLHAIASFHSSPLLLRAVCVHLLPSVMNSTSDLAQGLASAAVIAWRDQRNESTDSLSNLLFLLCHLLPRDPSVIKQQGLQQMITVALAQSDALLRKQGLYLLKVAFSHHTLLESDKKTVSVYQKTHMEVWESYISASEVIHMHHEQHLVEQVWPQVEYIIQSTLVVPQTDDRKAVNESSADNEWPVSLTFEWIQSLLLRVFSHDNPVVRRLFLGHFMQCCLAQWKGWGSTSGTAIDSKRSYVCDPSFHAFMLQRFLRILNEPLMYKTSSRETFQAQVTDFLSHYLGFQLMWMPQTLASAGTPSIRPARLLPTYLKAVHEAIFGDYTTAHSPEALTSMLQVFENARLLQAVATANCNSSLKPTDGDDLLDEAAIEQLRFIIEVHVMGSFSQAVRTKTLVSLQHALAGGYTNVSCHSVHSLARILSVFSLSNLLTANSKALLQLHGWLRSDNVFLSKLTIALQAYLAPENTHEVDTKTSALSAEQLARLVLFAADNVDGKLRLQSPLVGLIGITNVDSAKLIRFVGQLEEQLTSAENNPELSLTPLTFYGYGDENTFSCHSLFHQALGWATTWLLNAEARGSSDVVDTESVEYDHEMMEAAGTIVTQMATYAMEYAGELDVMEELDGLCASLKTFLSSPSAISSDQTIVLHFLARIASQSKAVDTLNAFQSASILQLVLSAQLNRHGSAGSRGLARYAIRFSSSKWALMHHVLQAASYVPTELLQSILDACVESLGAVGTDPLVLTHMVQVLSLALTQLAGTFVPPTENDDGIHGEVLDAQFSAVWGAYSDCKSKPDLLTRAVVWCLFQPAFLLSKQLSAEPDALMKRWFHKFMRFGELHRPNVVFHLTCRLCQVWRARPRAALWFVDEIADLLLYKEPLVNEKEQLTMDISLSGSGQANAAVTVGASGLSIKNKFVRIVVLSFLDETVVDLATPLEQNAEQQLMHAIISTLLGMTTAAEWQKQHMLNSDGFGKKIRCWQSLCVLSKFVTSASIDAVSELLWRSFELPHLTEVRFSMEIFAIRLLSRFPGLTIEQYVAPLLRNVNLSPQVATSVIFVCGYVVHYRVNDMLETQQQQCDLLLECMLPWMNSSHGHTRVLVQIMLSVLLPRYVHQQKANKTTSMDLRFLEQTLVFLSENKETKRMFRRQAKQLDRLRPEHESSLLGVLSSSYVNEFHELFPNDDVLLFSKQLQDTMAELYAQFQREHFVNDMAHVLTKSQEIPRQTEEVSTLAPPPANRVVQRKIDTSAILLDESVLPVAMQQRGELVDLNVRQKKRQPVILCASLVDKLPNLAGLARTCEIFNAQLLVVPNLRVCDDAMFSTISVTANKWIPMQEVKPESLVATLRRWKSQGFTIVAVEQTASSVCLSTYAFPSKIVIVLGKEKEGIPVDVLQVVDVCVEIPQFGLIRSLNVHVSGALLLWEYTQQQLQQA